MSKRCRGAAPIGAACRERFVTSIDETPTQRGKIYGTPRARNSKTLEQMAEHFPRRRAAGQGLGRLHLPQERVFQANKGRLCKTPSFSCRQIIAPGPIKPRRMVFPTNSQLKPVPKLRRRYARVLGS